MDALVHAVQALTDADPDLVVLSLDGVGAFDHIHRASFLQKLRNEPTLQALLPLVRSLYSTASTFLWVDDAGVAHEIRQGEGGEQGDPLMSALYALGQHEALRQATAELQAGEHLFAFLDDLYLLVSKARVAAAYSTLATGVAEHAGVQSHLGQLRA